MPGNADPSPQQITYVNFIWKGILLLLLLLLQLQLINHQTNTTSNNLTRSNLLYK